MDLSEIFWTFLVTGTFGFLLKIAHFCFKSKCTRVTCCCITVVRDPTQETQETQEKAEEEEKASV